MRIFAAVAMVAACLALAGCGPQKPVGWQNPLDVLEKTLPADGNNAGYVLSRMEYARLAIEMGCYSRAKVRLEESFRQFDASHSNVAAALGSEKYKYYKGETYERAMICFYLGYIAYQGGEYNDARIFFARALAEDRKAVVKKDTPEIYGDDFGMAYFWLGKAYQKLGDVDNARIAFQKAGRISPRKDSAKEEAQDKEKATAAQKACIQGEEWCIETFADQKKPELYISQITDLRGALGQTIPCPATLPSASAAPPAAAISPVKDAFLTCDYQKDANLVLTIELGNPPYKYLSGIQNETTSVGRTVIYPAHVMIYVDGHLAGEALNVVDLWHQAATQDRIAEKEGAQTGKALAKTALVLISGRSSDWDVTGDIRYWVSLRGRGFVHSAKLSAGAHTLCLKMYDINGNLLPRWTNTYYGIVVPASGEACVLLAPRFNGDNQLQPELLAKSLKTGATLQEP